MGAFDGVIYSNDSSTCRCEGKKLFQQVAIGFHPNARESDWWTKMEFFDSYNLVYVLKIDVDKVCNVDWFTYSNEKAIIINSG